MTGRARKVGAVAGLLVVLAASGCGGSSRATTTSGTALRGLLGITGGTCRGASPGGSYFRMITPAGRVGHGPYVSNADSACRDQSVTLLAPGRDGGLRLGRHQTQPAPAFGAGGNSTATRIVEPAAFFGVRFGVSTNPKDPQTGDAVPAPTASRDGGTLTVNLQAWSVAWNHQQFNQGAPKPGAGGARATGTIDPATGAYTLDWSSKIIGGPFNGFTGVWHLTGTLHSA